jgi:holo-ACP synthase/triphosphoribosyl-dephospho-CoA synthase
MREKTSSPSEPLLDGILAAKEERWAKKLALARSLDSGNAAKHAAAKPAALAVLTLRMPGPLRLSGRFTDAALSLHVSFARELRARGISLLHEEFLLGGDGPESYIAAAIDPVGLKRTALSWEKVHPWGELADLDVMDVKGAPLGRADLGHPRRTCLVCGGEAALCVREGRHGIEAIEARVEEILGRSEAGGSAEDRRLGSLALRAALAEAAAQPKPGLVGPFSRGAHRDMDYSTFLASAAAIGPWFVEFARLGRVSRDAAAELLPALRRAGEAAERDMFAATGGVNTHKGLIFSLGLLCAAAGRLVAEGGELCPESCTARASKLAREMSAVVFLRLEAARDSGAGEKDGDFRAAKTTGERLFLHYGVRGVRGEAEEGFPAARNVALPRLKAGLSAGLSRNDAMIDALLSLFTVVEDTNVLGRSGPDGLAFLRSGASLALSLGGMASREGRKAVAALDAALVEKNISPGGCADLLAVTAFLEGLAPA